MQQVMLFLGLLFTLYVLWISKEETLFFLERISKKTSPPALNVRFVDIFDPTTVCQEYVNQTIFEGKLVVVTDNPQIKNRSNTVKNITAIFNKNVTSADRCALFRLFNGGRYCPSLKVGYEFLGNDSDWVKMKLVCYIQRTFLVETKEKLIVLLHRAF